MGLKFLPRAGHTTPFASGNAFGQLARYIGRTFKRSDRPNAVSGAGAWVADAEPIEIDPAQNPEEAEHFRRQVRKDDPGLWPADAATAAWCEVPFVPLARDADGEWIAAPKSGAPAKPPEKKAEA